MVFIIFLSMLQIIYSAGDLLQYHIFTFLYPLPVLFCLLFSCVFAPLCSLTVCICLSFILEIKRFPLIYLFCYKKKTVIASVCLAACTFFPRGHSSHTFHCPLVANSLTEELYSILFLLVSSIQLAFLSFRHLSPRNSFPSPTEHYISFLLFF